MNVQHLIDAVVRQTTALIAQLATAGGVRAPLAHIANQVFLELTTELEAQGVSRKVSADMFGMALRAYIKKIRRLSESSTFRGRSLWEAVLDYVETGGVRTRAEVLRRFANDDESLVRGALHDLVDTGLVSSSGSGASVVYRKTTDEERNALLRNGTGLDEFLWALIYRQGPLPETQLQQQLGVRDGTLTDALARLQADGRAREQDGNWCASGFAVPLGSDVGWEAALFDHYQALVKTICARLARLGQPAQLADYTGGSTYTLDVWDAHPHRDEVLTTLKRVREQLADLRERVVTYNTAHPAPNNYDAVVFYAGQCVTQESLNQALGDLQASSEPEESSDLQPNEKP